VASKCCPILKFLGEILKTENKLLSLYSELLACDSPKFLSKESIMPSINAINPLSFQPMVSEWEKEQILQFQHHQLVSKKEPQPTISASKKKPPKVGDIRYVKPSLI